MFQKGDLVRWNEIYGDIPVVRDTGIGVVIGYQKYDYFGDKPTYIYRVYRNKYNDYMNFEDYTLQILKGEENEI
jgi:hypothetical protein